MTHDAVMEKRQRLFVAVELPVAVRLLLAERQRGLPGVRWTPAGKLHLTVRFIGEVPLAQGAVIKTGLKTVRAESFSLQVKDLDFFDRRPQAVLWAGIAASPGLLELKRQVDGALELHAGINAPAGRFSPHITLGRMKQLDRKALQAFAAGNEAAFFGAFPVESFTLLSSVLTPGGAVHTVEERYSLQV